MPTRPGQTIEKRNTEDRKEREHQEKKIYERLRIHFHLKQRESKIEVLHHLFQATGDRALIHIFNEVTGSEDDDDGSSEHLQQPHTEHSIRGGDGPSATREPTWPTSTDAVEDPLLEEVEETQKLAAEMERQDVAHAAQIQREEALRQVEALGIGFVEVPRRRRSKKRNADKPAGQTPERDAVCVDARTAVAV